MIIEFPKKYSVVPSPNNIYFTVSVPVENVKQVHELIKQQPWVSNAFIHGDTMTVFTSAAYEITQQQAVDALSKLCEYVMSPPVQVDTELQDELVAILNQGE